MLTTRLRMPSLASCSCVATQSDTSLPVPMQDHFRVRPGAPAASASDVGALREARGRRVLRAVERRQRLPRQDQRRRLVAKLEDDAPRLGDLVGVARADRQEARDRAQRQNLLDRLVRRAVLADADRVVREDVDRPGSP